MRATVLHGAGDIRLEDVADPALRNPTDAVVRVVAACVCGSDLWGYRGVSPTERPRRIGHEFVGIVAEVGSEVRTIKAGDFVIAVAVADGEGCDHEETTYCADGPARLVGASVHETCDTVS